MNRNRKWIAFMLVLALTVTLAVPVVANEEGDSNYRIHFGNSYIQFEKADILPYGKEHMLTFTLRVYNGESSSLSFNDYFLKLRSQSGQTFKLTRFDNETNTISAGGEKEYRYYANTEAVSDVGQLIFTLVRWNFDLSASNFETVVGEISIPGSQFTPVPAGESGTFDIDHIRAEAKIDRFRLRQDDDEIRVTLDMTLQNVSAQSIQYPQLDFQIVTDDGLHFPLAITRQEPSDLLRAQEEAEIDLAGNVPATVQFANGELLVTRAVQDRNGVPLSETIARLQLPAADPSSVVSIGEEKSYTNTSGTFQVSMLNLYRLPWEDEDMLTADFRIVNTDEKPLSLPQFAGQFKLDGHIDVAANAVITDRAIALQPREEATVHLIGKIPYTYSFSEVDILLQERAVSGEAEQFRDVFNFRHNSDFTTVRYVREGQPFVLDKTGRHYDISVYDVSRFESNSSDIYSVLLAFDNKESRLSEVPELTAQLELADGTVYPVNLAKPQVKTAPGGLALVEVSAAIPKRADTTGAKVLLGEAIAEGAPAQSGQPADSFVNPVAFAATESEDEVSDSLEDIEIAPFALTLDNVRTPYIYYNEVTFKFDYELKKDLLIDADRSNDKYRIELADADGEIWLERTFALENPGEDPTQMFFELGSDSIEIVEQFDSTSFKMNRFVVNVYHQTGNDHKKLLASKEFGWQTQRLR